MQKDFIYRNNKGNNNKLEIFDLNNQKINQEKIQTIKFYLNRYPKPLIFFCFYATNDPSS